MRRPPHGGTTRPGLSRPSSGFGRAPGRPGPDGTARAAAQAHRRWWEDATVLVDTAGRIHRAGRSRIPEGLKL